MNGGRYRVFGVSGFQCLVIGELKHIDFELKIFDYCNGSIFVALSCLLSCCDLIFGKIYF